MATATAPRESADLTPTETCAILGITPQHLRWLANKRRIKCRRTPLGRLYNRVDVERYRAEAETKPKRGRPAKATVAA